ncbi:hypothetical protein Tco_1069263 [Tanacetum coccineum]|uniref:SWIM-type domain-containing protein n=1 Tax=Tanacetum coccineum TaxID=301880 RepID=A0ABQ5HI74_9ASTR
MNLTPPWKSLPQHDSSTSGKGSVYESITPSCMPHGMLTPPTGFDDVVGSGVDSYGSSHDESYRVDDLNLNVLVSEEADVGKTKVLMSEEADGNGQEAVEASSDEQVDYDVDGIDCAYETQYHIKSGEDTSINDDDDCLVDKEYEIVEHDVDVHLFGISKDVPFDNIGVNNLVLGDVLEGDNIDVINPDCIDSGTSNDNEIRNGKLTRIPCKHVVAAFWNMALNDQGEPPLEAWANPCYWLAVWRETYSHNVTPPILIDISGRVIWGATC